MGLDTTHGCWSGAYSSFHNWRVELAKAAATDHVANGATLAAEYHRGRADCLLLVVKQLCRAVEEGIRNE